MMNPLKNMMGANPITKMIGNPMLNPENMLLNQLKQANPKAYEMFQQLRNSGQNPNDIINQMMSNMTEEQKQQLSAMASKLGIR